MVHQVERGQVSAIKVGINTLWILLRLRLRMQILILISFFYGGNYEIYILEC